MAWFRLENRRFVHFQCVCLVSRHDDSALQQHDRSYDDVVPKIDDDESAADDEQTNVHAFESDVRPAHYTLTSRVMHNSEVDAVAVACVQLENLHDHNLPCLVVHADTLLRLILQN